MADQAPDPESPARGPRRLLGRYTTLVLGAGATIVAMLAVSLVHGTSDPGHAATPRVVAT